MNTNDFNLIIQEAFNELNEKLIEEDLTLTVICAGGFVLSQYGLRTTKDVDGFYRSTIVVEKAIKEVGDKLNINSEDELWLNNSVMSLNSTPNESDCNMLYEFSNLKVLMVSLEYITGMKLKSGREKDLQDVADVLKLLKVKDALGFSDRISEMGFNDIDPSLVLEAFGTAYGMEWLQDYFIEHEKEIIKRL